MVIRFRARVSRGSRFSQIYVPKSVEVGAGDLVEVLLLQKKTTLCSHNVKDFPLFKQKVSEGILRIGLECGVGGVIIVGSFLTESTDYRDIDVLVIVDDGEKRETWAERVHKAIMQEFPLRVHVLALWTSEFERLRVSCPLTVSMLQRHISNKEMPEQRSRIVDVNRISSLLMLPEDALEVVVESRTLYECLRRVVTLERYLKRKSVDAIQSTRDVETMLGSRLFLLLKENRTIDEVERKRVRFILRERIIIVKELLKHG